MSNIGKVRTIAWSYPSSPNAERFGFDDTGCWTVEVYKYPDGLPEFLAGFADTVEAVKYAHALPPELGWCPRFLRFMSEEMRKAFEGTMP